MSLADVSKPKRNRPKANVRSAAVSKLSARDREIHALARKMADEEMEGIAASLVHEIVVELRALNAEVAAQGWIK